ncbi:tetratricopeptide repeat protein [Streptomyces sp. NBC_00663]|uniref:tetratricopeptide repeat protein n=1 Tax=Streptomyces sp. NBC_00663 TaxID=2975801 RepID=UPI002E302F65|nr:tetratricopeptide repeat protein [Streptomyces sp. NBC_00663]
MSGVFEHRPEVAASGDEAVAAGRDIGVAVTGAGAVGTQHIGPYQHVEKAVTVPPDAVSLPARVPRTLNLPDRAGSLFVGREPELARLDEAFLRTGGVVVHAVHGLGGIGKSTLAAHWAGRRAADFNPVWWITAETRADLDTGLAALARALYPALVGTVPEEALREATLQWLAGSEGWLLVLDNVMDPADVTWLLDRTPNGRFLITSRCGAASWRGTAESMDLDVLEPAEAVRLFTQIYDGPDVGVEELCAELGFLPLAVDQAAAYCREAAVTPRAYREWLATYPARLHAATAEGGDAERTVARVWRMTIDRLADTPLAEVFLRIIAWYGSDGVPRDLLAPLADPLTLADVLRRLAAHSMIRLHGGTVSVHRLVQAVARTPDERAREASERTVAEARRMAVALLGDAMSRPPGEGGGVASGRRYAEHAEALAAHVGEDCDDDILPTVLGMAGTLLGVATAHERSLALVERAVALAARTYGPDDTRYLNLRRALAAACEASGRRDRAIALYEEVLAECEATLGADHTETIDARGRLIGIRLDGPDLETGLHRLADHLKHVERVLGPEHPVLLNAMRPLLKRYRMLAEAAPESHGAGAVEAIERYLALARDKLQAEHVMTTADFMWELVAVRLATGDVERAVTAAEELVDFSREHWGADSFGALLARRQLALALMKAGDKDRARTLVSALLADCERALGDTPTAREFRSAVLAVLD